ncbi:hypothetical protein O3Q51_04745 [Cryomorphaceae bacterium 1068]|nr:hypothetical protein [Cryomorphaceae bacterium 1068]
MAKIEKLHTPSFTFYPDQRGFYYMKLKEGEQVSLEDISQVVLFIKDKNEGERQPVLIELGYGSSLAEGVYEFMAHNKNRFSTADAILISTFAHKISTTFYLRHYKPQRATRVFNDVFDALAWMEKQK